MKRYHEETHIIKREWKKACSLGRVLSKGHYRKKDGFDCGKSSCLCCHSDKFPRRLKTKQEIKSLNDFSDQLGDI